MKFNLGFLGLYNIIILSLEIEYFEYYYLFPLLKEILNYQGYTLKLKYLKSLTQQTVKNKSQLTKWVVFFYKHYNKIYFNNSFFRKNLKKNEKYKFCFQLEKKNYIEKNITNQNCLLKKTFYYLYKEKKRYKKKNNNQHIYNIKTKELLKMSLFFSNHLKNKKIIEKKYFFSFFLKFILYYKKWKADELYMKMAHIAYCENLIEFSIALFKMARFEKQTFFFISILKM
uniref:Uncharacterized protein n=1 Tax=Syntrichia filaris TaxID=1678074 RepID=A0A7D7FYI4_SYNFI|nr:hypothetical protein SfiCP_p030 [Syntrichia filaris]QMQ99575.1 hypothetical protein SfiCP_p030 [Syntrichia filaris]